MVEKNILSGVVMGFMAIVLGSIFIGIIADQEEAITTPQSIANESFTGVNATAVALANGNMTTVSAVRNSTHDTLTVTTDYTVSLDAGTITVLTGNGTYYADYNYEMADYVSNSATRSIVSIIVILFGVGVLAAAIGEARLKELFNL